MLLSNIKEKCPYLYEFLCFICECWRRKQKLFQEFFLFLPLVTVFVIPNIAQLDTLHFETEKYF